MRGLIVGLVCILIVACGAPGSSAPATVSLAQAEATALSQVGSTTPAYVASAKL